MQAARRKFAGMKLDEMPFDIPFVLGDEDEGNGRGGGGGEDDADYVNFQRAQFPDSAESLFQVRGQSYQTQIVDVADILLVPVCVTYLTADGDEEVTMFWMVVLRPTLAYNFPLHLQYLVNNVDKEVRMHIY